MSHVAHVAFRFPSFLGFKSETKGTFWHYGAENKLKDAS
uniref:Uncharacterized protein n=1 Tax=Anguilla anguilla TaxID=7936 RepID=A0A0E9UUP7_ANGAN